MSRGHFPGPGAAVLLAVGSWLASFLVLGLFEAPLDLAAGGIAEAVGLGTVALVATRAVPPPHPERLGLRGFSLRWLPWLLLFAPLTVLVSELDNVVRVSLPPEAAKQAVESTARALEQLTAPGPYEVLERWIVVVGLAPVLEEWLYRGVIQQGLVAHLGRVGGVLATAALFAIGHADFSRTPEVWLISFASVLLAGVSFGAVRLATGSLLACMVAHAAMNAAGLVALALADRVPVAGFNAPGDHTPAAILLPCALAVGAALWRMARAAARAPRALPIPEAEAPDDD